MLRTKRLQNEIKLFSKNPSPYLKVAPEKNNLLKWYFVLHDIDSEQYKDGVYLGIVDLPEAYPMKPPSFQMLTPNGRFQPNGKICTTFSNFHTEQWSTNWNVQGAILGLLSFMLDDTGHGLGSIVRSKEDRQRLAAASKKYNRKHYGHIMDEYFPDLQ